MRCDTQEDLEQAFKCLPLAAGILIIGAILIAFGAFNVYVASTSNDGGFMLILAYIIEVLIILCGLYCVIAAALSNASLMGAVPQVVNICKISVALILIVQWGQWLYMIYGPQKWRPGGNLANMIISTVLSVAAIAILCHGKSVAASIVLAMDKGLTGWEKVQKNPQEAKTKEADLEQGVSNPDKAASPGAKRPPMVKKPIAAPAAAAAESKTLEEEADDDEEEATEEEDEESE